ncbi:hypothetical protein BJF86_02770 [Serinicoccus sp. CNJ-927]|uniref:DUF6458 family protein n=1 Tax=Serinicoccus TaxID=265976 RepID=UPI0003B3B5C1|nr:MULTISPECIES: DUF6458 family protein [Serinicoccus]OLT18899.1 hypothetical protein BJF80_13660 [Serinicoccus sp. CUA-874]OLT41938.1 hypothetical protein BJF86_02770 [Serinicoccus sp. CNJ-927]
MGIGLGIFLLAVGAILSFAVGDLTSVVDLPTVGYILMAAGVLSLLLGLVMNTQRNNTTHREIIERNNRGETRYRDRDGY